MGGERVLGGGSAEPDLCFRKVTGGAGKDGLGRTVRNLMCPIKGIGVLIRTELAYLKGI